MGRDNKNSGQINGLIDRGCSLEGKLMFDGTVQINGDFKGEVLSDGTLVIGPEANVDARIQVDTIIIEGSVQGQIEAKRKVDLRKGSRLVADIVAAALVVEDGALFHGRCQMADEIQGVEVRGSAARDGAVIGSDAEDALMM